MFGKIRKRAAHLLSLAACMCALSLCVCTADASSANASGGCNSGKSYVSGANVTELIDGTAPFDDDDEAGDDSSESNLIVRSFDYVNYPTPKGEGL